MGALCLYKGKPKKSIHDHGTDPHQNETSCPLQVPLTASPNNLRLIELDVLRTVLGTYEHGCFIVRLSLY